MDPSRRLVIIIFSLSLLKFQELKAVRTEFNRNCAPLFSDLAEYQECGMQQLRSVTDCCARKENDWIVYCREIMTVDEMETSLGEKLEDFNIAELHSPNNPIGNRIVDYSVRHIIDRDHKLRGPTAQYYYIPSPLTSKIFNNRSYYNKFNEINYVHLSGKILIMPFVKDNHWIVIIVDIANKKIWYYDTLDPLLQTDDGIEKAYTYKEIFERILERRNDYDNTNEHIDITGWDLEGAIKQRQPVLKTRCNSNDGGVYALMFIDQFLNQISAINPDVFRRYLLRTIGSQNRESNPYLEDRLRYYNPRSINTPNGPVLISSCAGAD